MECYRKVVPETVLSPTLVMVSAVVLGLDSKAWGASRQVVVTRLYEGNERAGDKQHRDEGGHCDDGTPPGRSSRRDLIGLDGRGKAVPVAAMGSQLEFTWPSPERVLMRLFSA